MAYIIFYPIFTLAAAYIADNLCTKNENSSFFKLKEIIETIGNILDASNMFVSFSILNLAGPDDL